MISIFTLQKQKLNLMTNLQFMHFLGAAVKHSLGQFSIAPILDFQRDAAQWILPIINTMR